MKTLIYSLLGLAFVINARAKDVQYLVDKVAVVEMPAARNVELDINAKNTKTEIIVWDQDKVYIEANFSYRGKEEHPKIKEFLEEYEANVKKGVKGDKQAISIDTYRSLPSKVKIGWEEFAFFNWTFSPDEVEIRYTIKIPSKARLNLRHSYRQLELVGRIESLRLEQYSGKLKADEIFTAEMDLKYGEAQINRIQDARINAYENDLMGEDWQRLKLNAKYSNLKVKKIARLNGEAYESEFQVKDLGELDGQFKYSRLESDKARRVKMNNYETKVYLKELEELQLGETKYSRYEIDKVKRIKIGQAYEDKMMVKEALALDAGQSKYCQYRIEKLGRSYSLMGYECNVDIGGLGEESGDIKIDGKYLKIDIDLDGRAFQLNATMQYGKLSYPEHLVKAHIMESGSNYSATMNSVEKSDKQFTILINGYEVKARVH